MKDLYLVSYYFAPLGRADGVNRTYLVKYLAELGWNCHIITGINYKSLILNFQKDPKLLDLLSPLTKFQRFKSDKNWLAYDVRKLLGLKHNLRNDWISNVENGFQLSSKGILFAIVPPLDNAYVAYQLSLKYKCPMVLYYPDDVLDVPEHVFNHASAVYCVTPEIKKSLIKKYGKKDILVIEHGFSDLIDCPVKETVGDPVKITYAGSLNFRTKPEVFLQGYSQLNKTNPRLSKEMHVDFYAPGGYYFNLFLKRYMSENILFKGYLPFNHLLTLLPSYDMALTVNHADIAFPSKVFHYLNAGLPIFAVTEHAGLADFIKENDIGITSSLDIEEIAQKIQSVLSDRNQILRWRENVMRIRTNYQMKNRIKELHQSIEKIVIT